MRYDLRGKVTIITGANSGIGKAASIQLAQSGATVIMGCRSIERGTKALEDNETKLILSGLGNFNAADLKSIKAYVELSGMGNAIVRVEKELTATITEQARSTTSEIRVWSRMLTGQDLSSRPSESPTSTNVNFST